MALVIPPNNRSVGSGDPPGDMNNTSDVLGLLAQATAQLAGTTTAVNSTAITALQTLQTTGGGALLPVNPSGDTSGVTDSARILAALTGFPRRKASLGPGIFYLAVPLVPQNNTWLQGSGILTTVIQQGSSFTGTCMIQAAPSMTISDLQLKAPSSTTASNVAADAISITQQGAIISGVTVKNINFANINGWCVNFTDLGTFGAPTYCVFENLRDGQHNAGGIAFFGAARTIGAWVNNVSLNANGGTSTTLDGCYIQDVFDIEFNNFYFGVGGTSTGSALHLLGHNANARFVHTEIGSGAAGLLIEDGANGHASNIIFDACTFQTSTTGVDLEGTCTDIQFTNCKFYNNVTHGATVNTTGNKIKFQGCGWGMSGGPNGAGHTGTNYDLNWTGAGTGDVNDCEFASAIVSPSTTAGVQVSVNVAAGQQVVFTNARFTGTSSTSANWFTGTPSAALVVTAGAYSFPAGLTVPNANPSPDKFGLASWTADPLSFGSTQYQLGAAGTGYGSVMTVAAPVTITKMYMILGTLGVTLTTSQCFGVLYNAANNLIGYSTDQAGVWATPGTTGLVTMTLTAQSAGSLTLTPGKYWAGVYYNGTTAPKFMSANSGAWFAAINAGIVGSAARAVTLFTSATTTIPPTCTQTAGGELLWIALA